MLLEEASPRHGSAQGSVHVPDFGGGCVLILSVNSSSWIFVCVVVGLLFTRSGWNVSSGLLRRRPSDCPSVSGEGGKLKGMELVFHKAKVSQRTVLYSEIDPSSVFGV